MEPQGNEYQFALHDFRRARRRASLEQIMAFLRGRSDELLSYEEVRRKLQVTGMSSEKLQEIPLDAIVGSVGRYKDFTRNFLPRRDSDQGRWAAVKAMTTGMAGLPPIEVYQIGDVYFVSDGNHRVSVARQLGAQYIEAYVTKIQTKVPISTNVQPDELTMKAEYAEFLSHTHLDELRPGVDLMLSLPGRYQELEEQIREHRHFMGNAQQREIPYNEAVVNWYDTIYLPITDIITQKNILKNFPHQTLTDLYLWISEYRATLRQADSHNLEEEITVMHEKLPITPDLDLDKLILDAEYVDFLEHTHIEQIRPEANLRVTAPGKYRILEKHIEVHRYFMGMERQSEIPYQDAVAHWYDTVYRPLIAFILKSGMLRDFPNRTETDLYLWITEYRAELEKRLGWKIQPEKAATDLQESFSPTPDRILSRLGEKVLSAITPEELESGPPPGEWRKEIRRRNDQLFSSMLVPVSGQNSGWFALEQAIQFARFGGQYVYGLHVITADNEEERETALAIKAEFARRCQEAGIQGALAIEQGEIAHKICERAHWADLVIIHMAHPPQTTPLVKPQSGIRTILRRCSRPILVVPKVSKPIRRALLAYDGSSKADEALFVGAYLSGEMNIPLVVVTVSEIGRTSLEVLSLAKRYLHKRQVNATCIQKSGSVSHAILAVAQEYECDLIVMGGYGRGPVLEFMLGSTVDPLLRATQIPVLICR